MSEKIESTDVQEDEVAFQDVVDWRRDHGVPEYGYDSKCKKSANFTGWVRNPDIGQARNIRTGEKASYDSS